MEIYSYEQSVGVKLNPATEYAYELVNQDTNQATTGTVTTDSAGIAEIPFDDANSLIKYDAWYQLSIYRGTISPDNIIYVDTVAKVRPYVNAPELANYLGVDKDKAIEYESIARSLINDVIGFAFEFKRLQLELVGNDTDTLHTHERIVRVHSITENNAPLWSTGDPDPFIPTKNYFGIQQLTTRETNRLEFVPVFGTRYSSPLFKEHNDYVIDVDAGWPVVPEDIKKATKLLANDIKCGTNRYVNKYVQSVSTDTQRITYFHKVIATTGNLIVDNLISPYTQYSVRVRVL